MSQIKVYSTVVQYVYQSFGKIKTVLETVTLTVITSSGVINIATPTLAGAIQTSLGGFPKFVIQRKEQVDRFNWKVVRVI